MFNWFKFESNFGYNEYSKKELIEMIERREKSASLFSKLVQDYTGTNNLALGFKKTTSAFGHKDNIIHYEKEGTYIKGNSNPSLSLTSEHIIEMAKVTTDVVFEIPLVIDTMDEEFRNFILQRFVMIKEAANAFGIYITPTLHLKDSENMSEQNCWEFVEGRGSRFYMNLADRFNMSYEELLSVTEDARSKISEVKWLCIKIN